MRRRLVLWDVDYTLVDSDGVGRQLYETAFREMFGRPMPQLGSMSGRTDRAIAIEALGLAGVAEHLDRDGPVGPPGHGPWLRHRAAEHLPERDPVQLPADPVGVDQRVVDIPQDQPPAHPATVSVGQPAAR